MNRLPNRVNDILDELAYNQLLDYKEIIEFERNGLEHHFNEIRKLGAQLRKANNNSYYEIADKIVNIVKRANGTSDSIQSKNKIVSSRKIQLSRRNNTIKSALDTWVDPRSKVKGWKVKVLDVYPDDYAGSTTAKVELFDPEGNSQGEEDIYIHRQDVKIGETYDARIDGLMAMPRIIGVPNISYDEVPSMKNVTRERYLKSSKQIKSSPDYHDYDYEYQDIHEEDIDDWLNIPKQEYRVGNKAILKAEGDSATRTVTEILDPSCELKVGDSVNDFSSNKDYLDDVYNGNFVITSTKSKENNMKDDIVLSGLDMNKSSLNCIYCKTGISPANSSRKPIKSSADLYDFTFEDEDGFDRHAFYAEENNGSFEVTDRDPQYKEVRIGDIITVADAKDMGLEWKEVLTSSRKLIKSSNRSVMIYIRDPKTNKWASQAWCDPYQKDSYYYDRAEIIDNPGGYDDRERVIYWDDDINDAVAFSTPEKAKEYPLKGELYTAEDTPLFGVKLDTIQPLNNSRKPIKSSTDYIEEYIASDSFDERVYQYGFDYIITNGDTASDVENRIEKELNSIYDIELVGNPGINNTSWTVEEYWHGLKNIETSDGLVHQYTFDYIITNGNTVSDVENSIENEIYSIDGIEVLGASAGDTSWSYEEYGITSSRKPIKSGKKSVTRRQIEDELDRVLENKRISLSNEVYKETVDYILSFWDDDFDNPKDVEEAVHEWYLDTKRNFPDVFKSGNKVASSRHFNWVKSAYLEYIHSSRKPIKSDLDFVNKGDKTIVKKNGRIVAFIGERPYGGFYYAFGKPSASHYMSFDVDDYETAVSRIKEFAEDEEGVFSSSRKPIKSLLKRN